MTTRPLTGCAECLTIRQRRAEAERAYQKARAEYRALLQADLEHECQGAHVGGIPLDELTARMERAARSLVGEKHAREAAESAAQDAADEREARAS